MSILYQQNLEGRPLPYLVFLTDIQDYPPHWHSEYEIIYNLDEPFELTIGESTISLNTGDIYIVEPHIIHGFKLQEKPQKRFILQYDIAPLEEQRLKKLSQTHFTDKDQVYPQLMAIINHIIKGHKRYSEDQTYLLMSKIYELAHILETEVDKLDYSKAEIIQRTKKMDRIQVVFDYVSTNYKKHITLEDAASISQYSTFYFTRFFKTMTGMTFHDYLTSVRVMAASEQLLKTEDSITEISLTVGFNSVKTFNRVFKMTKSCSPSEYRKLGKR